jgi:uncharacterized membrane protein YeaQ/YmgE (transglycosylase-associated protein family)
MIGDLLGWLVFGLIAGAIARLLMPGKDPMGCLATIALGVAGSFLGGFISFLIFGDSGDGIEASGMVGAILGGILVLLLFRKFSKR